jgi:hypothetical protein
MSSNGNERGRRSAAAVLRWLGTGRVFFRGDATLLGRNHQRADATVVGDVPMEPKYLSAGGTLRPASSSRLPEIAVVTVLGREE